VNGRGMEPQAIPPTSWSESGYKYVNPTLTSKFFCQELNYFFVQVLDNLDLGILGRE